MNIATSKFLSQKPKSPRHGPGKLPGRQSSSFVSVVTGVEACKNEKKKIVPHDQNLALC